MMRHCPPKLFVLTTAPFVISVFLAVLISVTHQSLADALPCGSEDRQTDQWAKSLHSGLGYQLAQTTGHQTVRSISIASVSLGMFRGHFDRHLPWKFVLPEEQQAARLRRRQT
ncbi:hypothetical protein EYF80_025241 [Liparis tanakae]|uniref:Uncharacterized protein n=1 Tax=Liparis tanakae TaxID=230148 RepID=A0A4Z2HHS3_9TELE|nr:hypothetical protein EYF80_025241 [Liparis tanakae]